MRARDAEMPLPPEYNSTLCSLSGPSALGLRNCAVRYSVQQTAAYARYGFTGKVSRINALIRLENQLQLLACVSQSVSQIPHSYQRSTWSTYIHRTHSVLNE